ncbi:MAG: DUF4179 domain-containing protein [Lachnospiraceae bacterium]|nr:DUF4179 domain-containing protein [Lachnospiraceae bacterium]
MDTFQKEIKQILDEETPVPKVVQRKAEEAFMKIQNQEIGPVKKSKFRWSAVKVAASFAVALVLCTTAMAATGHFSLLSAFHQESPEVQKRASELRDQDVKQTDTENEKISQWVNFRIREAICDKNKVRVLVEASPAKADRYLLVPSNYDIDTSVIENLHIQGEKETEQTIAEYAAAHGKECIYVDAFLKEVPIVVEGEHYTEADGTFLMAMNFENSQKNKKLSYQCEVNACPVKEFKDYSDMIKDTFAFTLTDQTDLETVIYQPVEDTPVQGTKLVVDEVTFEKSDLEMICHVKFHYTGKAKALQKDKDDDICFYLLDSKGNIVESGGDGNTQTEEDGVTMVQSWTYSLKDLPDTLTFQAKDVMTKKVYGKVSVQRKTDSLEK